MQCIHFYIIQRHSVNAFKCKKQKQTKLEDTSIIKWNMKNNECGNNFCCPQRTKQDLYRHNWVSLVWKNLRCLTFQMFIWMKETIPKEKENDIELNISCINLQSISVKA